MIRPRQLLALALPLALAGAVVIAQPATPESTEARPGAADPAPATGQTTTDADKDKTQDSSPARTESPFVYRPSEEISEDLPVSFPVDI